MESFTDFASNNAMVEHNPFDKMYSDFFYVQNVFDAEHPQEYRIYQRQRQYDPEDSASREVARCWSEPVAAEIVRMLNRKISN